MNQVLVVDPLKCSGCRTCESACSLIHFGESGTSKSVIRIIAFQREAFFYPHVCHQCKVPYCVDACPAEALVKNPETGVVELKRDKCIGCKLCLEACPFGAMAMTDDGLAAKCDLCGGDPECVKFCDYDAIRLGDADEISQSKRLTEAQGIFAAIGNQPRKLFDVHKISTYGLEE